MKRIIKALDKSFINRFDHQYQRLLQQEIIGSCTTVLDVGCGSNSPLRFFSNRLSYSCGVDAFEKSIEISSVRKIHNEYRLMNVMEIGNHFKEGSFDCVLASDLIEHLTKDDGRQLLELMERIARKKVIVYTPNGFLEQREYDGNAMQVHLSGWRINEIRKLGYRVTGVNGLKYLRGERACFKGEPYFLWKRLSLLTQVFTTPFPRLAFQIFCVKEL